MPKTARYNSFDLLKAVCSIAVVFIHYNWNNDFGIALKTACRFAVPCFLFISGFFCVKDGALVSREKMLAKRKHILSLVLYGISVYAVVFILNGSLLDMSFNLVDALRERLVAPRLIKLAVTNDPLIYAHLWYLLAVIYIYSVMIPFAGKKVSSPIVGLLALCLTAGFSCLSEFRAFLHIQTSLPLGDQRLYYHNLFVFRALPFFLFGVWAGKKCSTPRSNIGLMRLLANISPVVWITIAFAGMLLSVKERTVIGFESQFYVGTYITVAALCCCCVAHPNAKIRVLNHIGRDLSLNIYILHIACGSGISLAAKYMGLWGNENYSLLRPFFILAATLLVSELIFLKTKPKEDHTIMVTVFQKLKSSKFLFTELAKRDFKQKYKRTVLGMGWSILSPLLTLLVMRLVFTHFFGHSIAHYTTYLFCGNLVYSYFKESTTGGMNALMSNSGIITKVNIPKYMFLLSKNVSSLINFGLSLCVFFIFALVDGISFGPHFLALLYPIVCLVLFNIGMGLILSALFVFFRDTSYLYDIFTLLLMYMSAIFYQVNGYSATVQRLFLCNPIYCYIKYFRVVVLDGAIPSFSFHCICAAYALIVLAVGSIVYKKNNHMFLYYM